MILDKDWFFDNCGELNSAMPVERIAAGYELMNYPDDISFIQELLARHGIDDNFNWIVENTARINAAVDTAGTNGIIAIAKYINGVPFIAFDVAVIMMPTMEDSFGTVVIHELVHLDQYINGEITSEGNKVIWHGDDGSVVFDPEEYNVGFLGIVSIAYQYALPWEKPAYDAEMECPNIDPIRRLTIGISRELLPLVMDEKANPNLEKRAAILWLEFTYCLMALKGLDEAQIKELFEETRAPGDSMSDICLKIIETHAPAEHAFVMAHIAQ